MSGSCSLGSRTSGRTSAGYQDGGVSDGSHEFSEVFSTSATELRGSDNVYINSDGT